MVYVVDSLFWARSKSDVDKVMKCFKEYGPIYNWEHSKGESVSEFLGIYINMLDNSLFQFIKLD